MNIKYLKELPDLHAPAGYRYVLVKVTGSGYGKDPFTYRGITVAHGISFIEGHDITGWVNHLPKDNPDHNLEYIDDQTILGKYLPAK